MFAGVVEGRGRDVLEAWSVVTEAAESEAVEERSGEDDALALAEDAKDDVLPPDVLLPDVLPPDAKTIWRLAIWNRSVEV